MLWEVKGTSKNSTTWLEFYGQVTNVGKADRPCRGKRLLDFRTLLCEQISCRSNWNVWSWWKELVRTLAVKLFYILHIGLRWTFATNISVCSEAHFAPSMNLPPYTSSLSFALWQTSLSLQVLCLVDMAHLYHHCLQQHQLVLIPKRSI